jgi:hypothetical protein
LNLKLGGENQTFTGKKNNKNKLRRVGGRKTRKKRGGLEET